MQNEIPILLSTGSIFHLPLDDIYRVCKKSRFDGIELLLGPELAHVPFSRFAQLSRAYGVSVPCIHAPFFPQPPLGDTHPEAIKHSIDLARLLGSVMVNAHPFGLMSEPEEARRLVAATLDLALSVENMPQIPERPNDHDGNEYYATDPGDLQDFACEIGLKLTFDVTHFATTNRDIMTGYDLFKPNLINIHVSDYVAGYQHLLPGLGTLPLARLLAAVSRDRASRFVTLEVIPDVFPEDRPDRIIPMLSEAREFLQNGLSG